MPRLEPLEGRDVPSTLTVLNNHDSGAGSLRHAIAHAQDGDTIVFDPGLIGQTITLTSGQLKIKTSVDIEGPGAGKLAVSGGDAFRVFDVKEGLTVAIGGLTITHGRAVGGKGGGGVLNLGSTLALRNDVLSCNAAFGDVAQGGAVSNQNGGSLTVVDSTFIGNRAVANTEGGLGFGGGLFNGSFTNTIETHATVSGCTFLDNRAVGGDGGIVRGFFNVGSANGGGIENETGGTLTVEDSTFIANQAIAGNGGSGGRFRDLCVVDVALGGGISSADGTALVVSRSTFSHNQAVGGSNASGSTRGQSRVGNGAGGGLGNLGVATVTDSTFDHNQALGGSGNTGGSGFTIVGQGSGGGISCSFFGSPAVLTVSNSTFAANRAVGGAGNTLGTFQGNGFGGGLANFVGTTATISNCTFTGNKAVGGSGCFGGKGGDGLGGAVANFLGSTLTVSACTLSGNQAIGGAGGSGADGGDGFGGGVCNDGQSALTILTSTAAGNEAAGGAAGGGGAGQGIGGGLYLAAGGSACLDAFSVAHVKGNHASTSDDNIFGTFTPV
jgi:hypothetical protein